VHAGLTNLTFELADATDLPVPDGSFDGAVTRLSAS
jgi:ubiquinone/menaquinone biosynthesis C-methylase UbiE